MGTDYLIRSCSSFHLFWNDVLLSKLLLFLMMWLLLLLQLLSLLLSQKSPTPTEMFLYQKLKLNEP